jgi:hypothetical protein
MTNFEIVRQILVCGLHNVKLIRRILSNFGDKHVGRQDFTAMPSLYALRAKNI